MLWKWERRSWIIRLPHDRIRRAADFKPLDAQALFIPRLKELSQERVNACKDFSYVIQDVMKTKDRLKANTLVLNKAAREKELAESDAQQKERNTERRTRFAKMAKEDKEITEVLQTHAGRSGKRRGSEALRSVRR